ncbi:D-aminoacyl-tRNA deacylase 1-like isoform X3 [Acipenser ruthenus]|uniref:D-aminoacyl-tRNA deacylase 1-like isoform X3 n=1 Tax=Acipenser ruthenus TaxID=7906 RepID=UPI0027419BCB|nr:D-aminoacyl-tRNA deacylase 1-like isoform X3 [Acipenser ruthenus]
MKAIIQRVAKASVTVGEEQISSIGKGICVLLGISVEDTRKDTEYMVRKILNLRLFDDENGKHWCKSVMDKQYEVLCVSQFTLQCILKGNKPDYHTAMAAEQSEPFYNDFLEHMRKTYKPEVIKDGTFGAYMQQAKLEKQQQWKEKTRSKGPSESGKEKAASRAEVDPSTSSGAEGDVSSERES